MDDLDSSWFLVRAFAGPVAALASALAVAVVIAPVVLYVIARWRAHREPVADPQLGIKFALHFFAISAFQLGLAGSALLLRTMIIPGAGDAKSAPYRAALAMLVPAGIVLGLHLLLLRRTNDHLVTGVRRLFAGYNLVVTGLVGFVALVLGFQALFAKGSTHELGHTAGALVLVYGTAWAVLGWRFGQLVLGADGFGAASAPPAAAMPPAPLPPAAPRGAVGGLPPLGGGSYPPLDR